MQITTNERDYLNVLKQVFKKPFFSLFLTHLTRIKCIVLKLAL